MECCLESQIGGVGEEKELAAGAKVHSACSLSLLKDFQESSAQECIWSIYGISIDRQDTMDERSSMTQACSKCRALMMHGLAACQRPQTGEASVIDRPMQMHCSCCDNQSLTVNLSLSSRHQLHASSSAMKQSENTSRGWASSSITSVSVSGP